MCQLSWSSKSGIVVRLQLAFCAMACYQLCVHFNTDGHPDRDKPNDNAPFASADVIEKKHIHDLGYHLPAQILEFVMNPLLRQAPLFALNEESFEGEWHYHSDIFSKYHRAKLEHVLGAILDYEGFRIAYRKRDAPATRRFQWVKDKCLKAVQFRRNLSSVRVFSSKANRMRTFAGRFFFALSTLGSHCQRALKVGSVFGRKPVVVTASLFGFPYQDYPQLMISRCSKNARSCPRVRNCTFVCAGPARRIFPCPTLPILSRNSLLFWKKSPLIVLLHRYLRS